MLSENKDAGHMMWSCTEHRISFSTCEIPLQTCTDLRCLIGRYDRIKCHPAKSARDISSLCSLKAVHSARLVTSPRASFTTQRGGNGMQKDGDAVSDGKPPSFGFRWLEWMMEHGLRCADYLSEQIFRLDQNAADLSHVVLAPNPNWSNTCQLDLTKVKLSACW